MTSLLTYRIRKVNPPGHEFCNNATSLYRYFSTNKRNAVAVTTESISTFLREELIITDAGATFSPHLWFPNPITMWCQLNYNAITASKALGDRSSFIRYEDLIENPEEIVENIMNNLNVKRRSGSFKVPENRTKNLSENNHKTENFFTEKKFDKGAVTIDQVIKSFTKEDLFYIREQIPERISQALGYELI